MKRARPAKLCYYLLLACFPASMVLVVWLAPPWLEWLRDNWPRLHEFLYRRIYPMMPSWLQYFAVQTLAAGVAICGTLYLVGGRERPRWPRWNWRHAFPALVGAYAVWAGLTYYWSAWPYATRAYFIRELPFYFLCVAAMYLFARPERWVSAAKVFAVSAFVEAVLQGAIIVYFARENGWTLRKAFIEKTVFFSNPNFGCPLMLTAGFIALAFLILTVRACPPKQAGRRSSPRPGATVAALVVALFAYAFIFLAANALAAYVAALAAGCAYALCLLPIKRKAAIVYCALAVAVVAVIAVMASETLWTRTLRWAMSPRRTTHLRVVDWAACAELYVRRPLHGWGMGTFPATHARFQVTLARMLPFVAGLRTTHPHNEFARVASEQGLVGLLLYLGILGYAFAASYRALRDQPLRMRLVGYALWGGALTFVVQASFGKAPMNWSFSANYWLLLGLLASASRWSHGPPGSASPDEPLRVGAAGWITLALVLCAVGWGWWEWARGAYASTVYLNQSRVARFRMAQPDGEGAFDELERSLALARPRCLWPDEILHAEYGVGLFLHHQEHWARAARQFERIQQMAPEFLKTRLYLAESYMHLDRRQEAAEQLDEFMSRDPYELEAYALLGKLAGHEAAMLALEDHVLSRLHQDEDWIAEDFPTANEVSVLLNLYVMLGRWQRAREMIMRVRDFYAEADVTRPVDAFAEVRRLERHYEQSATPERARGLREIIPEAWERGREGR